MNNEALSSCLSKIYTCLGLGLGLGLGLALNTRVPHKRKSYNNYMDGCHQNTNSKTKKKKSTCLTKNNYALWRRPRCAG